MVSARHPLVVLRRRRVITTEPRMEREAGRGIVLQSSIAGRQAGGVEIAPGRQTDPRTP
jgi:hypothetical protein